MSFASLLSVYLTLNVLIAIAYGALVIAERKAGLSARSELRLHYGALAVVFVLALAQPLMPSPEIFQPPAKLWSAESMKSFDGQYQAASAGFLKVSTPLGSPAVDAGFISFLWALLGAAFALASVGFAARDVQRWFVIRRGSFLVRSIGRVRIFVNDGVSVPFAYRSLRAANVVVPSGVLASPRDFRMVIAHELMHHRHGDTAWVYPLWLLKTLSPWNPAIWLWNETINEIQEFACDEALVDQRKVESRAYVRCLVEVAQTAISRRSVPACASGMALSSESKLLKRRVQKMLFENTPKKTGSRAGAIALLLASLMCATAFASKGLVQDRRVSLEQAQAMASKAKAESGFPVEVNELVLRQLNRYIGTPEGREFMRTALQRMENYRALVSEATARYGVPGEIMAIPIAESGYENLPPKRNPYGAAGLWQFIASTARTYGLVVDDRRDERLDVEVETDAAMRYLKSNNLQFRDWNLAVLAYNMGERAVQKAIEETGSRDAWTLIRKGYEGDKDYLAKVVASILIMQNPDSVQ